MRRTTWIRSVLARISQGAEVDLVLERSASWNAYPAIPTSRHISRRGGTLVAGPACCQSSSGRTRKALRGVRRTGKDQAKSVTAVLIHHDTDLKPLEAADAGAVSPRMADTERLSCAERQADSVARAH
jgi:hypothetical protein